MSQLLLLLSQLLLGTKQSDAETLPPSSPPTPPCSLQYAGNLLVYSRGGDAVDAACSGDWFGGLTARDAPAFLDALLACKAPRGAVGAADLRRWWRGRIGLDKPAQVAYFEAALKDIEDLK